jgi:hypothetical protein
MNSPQPLSAPQRGAKNALSPFFPPTGGEKGAGDEYMKTKSMNQIIIIHS